MKTSAYSYQFAQKEIQIIISHYFQYLFGRLSNLNNKYRPNKSYENSKFSMIVTYNAIEYEELVAKLEMKRKCCEAKIEGFE